MGLYQSRGGVSGVSCLALRDDVEWPAGGQTKDAEVAPAQSENSRDLFAMCQVQQGGVGELELQILVSRENGDDSRKIGLIERHEFEWIAAQGCEEALNGSKQPGRFCNYRLACEESPLDATKLLDGGCMLMVPSRENRH
jgi:hypothetical protein